MPVDELVEKFASPFLLVLVLRISALDPVSVSLAAWSRHWRPEAQRPGQVVGAALEGRGGTQIIVELAGHIEGVAAPTVSVPKLW